MDAEAITAMFRRFESQQNARHWKELHKGLAFYNQGKYADCTGTLSSAQTEDVLQFWTPVTADILPGIEYYSQINGTYDKRYVHDGLFYSFIDRQLNHYEFAQQFDHKAYYPLLFEKDYQPTPVGMRINGIWLNGNYGLTDMKHICNACIAQEEVIVKPARGSCGGIGVTFFRGEQTEQLRQYLLSTKIDLTIQQVIRQHPVLASFHPESVNTIRMVTLLWKGKPILLKSVLRMGIGKSRVDNVSSGGLTCGIDVEGIIQCRAFDKAGTVTSMLPDGNLIKPVKIPGFQESSRLVQRLCVRIPYCRLIAWDIAIDTSGMPVLIETNLIRGEIDFLQWCSGPLLGDYTEEIWHALSRNLKES